MRRHFILAPIFTDRCIFQANKPIRIFGRCKKGVELNIEFLDQKQTMRTKSDRFLFTLKSVDYQKKNFSFKIYTKKQEETIYNCQIGEVFLITGAQNVSLSLKDTFFSDQANINADIRFFELDEEFSDGYDYEIDRFWKQYGRRDMHDQSAFAYIFARTLYDIVKIPIGIITCRDSETSILSWMSKSDIESNQEIGRYLQTRTKEQLDRMNPSYLYENCIKEIAPLELSGVIFYQGETDYEAYDIYESAMRQIIKCYRVEFKNHVLPFILTQIAGYDYPGADDFMISSLRIAQSNFMNDTNRTYVVSAIDLGEEYNITPKNKTVISKRLTALVMEKIMKKGKNNLSPTYYSYKKQAGTIVINTNNNYMNLVSHSKKVLGFTYTEDGTNFMNVTDIELRGIQIVIHGMSNAKELRYSFFKFPYCDVYSANELPLLPFRIKFN